MNDIAIKDIKNLFTIKKYKTVKNRVNGDMRNLFRLKKENKAITNIVLRDIRNYFEHEEEENYYKTVRVGKFWNNKYIEYESNGDRNKILSVEEYLNKSRPYLKDIINNRNKSDA